MLEKIIKVKSNSHHQTIPTQGLDERFASSHVIAKKRPNELHCVLWEKRKTFRFAINCWALHGVTHEIVQTILEKNRNIGLHIFLFKVYLVAILEMNRCAGVRENLPLGRTDLKLVRHQY